MALERRAYTGPSPQCGLRAATHAATSRQVAAVAWKARARAPLYPAPGPRGGVGAPPRGAPSRQVAAVAWKARARARLERPRVQILVVVANIQTRTLKTEVEKGSM